MSGRATPRDTPSAAGADDAGARRRAHAGWTRSDMVHGGLLTACLGVFLVVCKLYLDQYAEIRKLEDRRLGRVAELRAARESLEHLEREVGFLGTLGGVEKLAREKLKYINPDEVIVLPVRP